MWKKDEFGNFYLYKNKKIICRLKPLFTIKYVYWLGKKVFGDEVMFYRWLTKKTLYDGKAPYELTNEKIVNKLFSIEYGIYT